MRKEKTLALAKVLQHCCEQAGGSYGLMCSKTRDLQSCMVDLMQIEDEVLEIPAASPKPKEEATLLTAPQASSACPVTHDEKSPEPEAVASPEEMATEPQGAQVHLPLLLGFTPLASELELHLVEEDKILIRVSNPEGDVWPTLTPIGVVNFIVFRNECTRNIEYDYETEILESLDLNPAHSRPTITDL